MGNKIITIAAYVFTVFGVVVSLLLPSTGFAQTSSNPNTVSDSCRTLQIGLYRDGKPVAGKFIKRSERTKYKLRVNIESRSTLTNPCPLGEYQVKYEIFAPALDGRDSGTTVESSGTFSPFPVKITSTDFQFEYDLSAAALRRYDYSLSWFNSGIPAGNVAKFSVYFNIWIISL